MSRIVWSEGEAPVASHPSDLTRLTWKGSVDGVEVYRVKQNRNYPGKPDSFVAAHHYAPLGFVHHAESNEAGLAEAKRLCEEHLARRAT